MEVISKVHGLDEELILGGTRHKEIMRAQHQFRYLLTEHMGLREGARHLDISPACLYYSKKSHSKAMDEDFYYRETFEITKMQLQNG